MTTYPENDFWDFSLSVYRLPGVADACLFLQDRFGLDVNILLFCIWNGASGRQALDADELRDCIRRTRDWRMRVVEPLREIRRICRSQPLGVPDFLVEAFLPTMRDAELDAERVEQLVLADIPRRQADEVFSDAQRAIHAGSNLQAYVRVAECDASAQLDECLRTLFDAAFPGHKFPPPT